MDETAFWAIIRRCHEAAAGEMGRKCDLIKTEMIALSKKDAQAFARYLNRQRIGRIAGRYGARRMS
jgi:hypothetical protein